MSAATRQPFRQPTSPAVIVVIVLKGCHLHSVLGLLASVLQPLALAFLLSYLVSAIKSLSAKFLAPRITLLLRRAVRVEIVELATGKLCAAPLAVFFLGGPFNRQHLRLLPRRPRFRRPLAFFRRRRSCLEGLAHVLRRPRRIFDEKANRALLHACAAAAVKQPETQSHAA